MRKVKLHINEVEGNINRIREQPAEPKEEGKMTFLGENNESPSDLEMMRNLMGFGVMEVSNLLKLY